MAEFLVTKLLGQINNKTERNLSEDTENRKIIEMSQL